MITVRTVNGRTLTCRLVRWSALKYAVEVVTPSGEQRWMPAHWVVQP
jgi:hypothetical protein